MYAGYSGAFQDDVPFVNSTEISRIAKFRFLTAVEAQNDVESTSRVQIAPKFGPVAPGELLLLLPQSNVSDPKRVDQYSIYTKGASGTLFVTDSTFIGWQLTISDHDTCLGAFERDGLACCEWIAVPGTNDGSQSLNTENAATALCLVSALHHISASVSVHLHTVQMKSLQPHT